jgi:peroxiredoxin
LRRYSFLADDGVIEVLNLEEGRLFTVSEPDDMLKLEGTLSILMV